MKSIKIGLLFLAFSSISACGGNTEDGSDSRPPVRPTLPPTKATPTPGITPTPGSGNQGDLVTDIESGISTETRTTENYEISVVLGQVAPLDERTSSNSNYSIFTFDEE